MSESRVKVRGTGRAWGRPDHARITIEISAKAPEGDAAFEEVAVRSRKLEEVLHELGIPSEAIASRTVELRDDYRRDQQPPDVIAQNVLEVTVPDQDTVGRLITAAIRETDANVSGLSWELEPDNELHREAIRRAGEGARAKAEAHAEAMGVTLGPVLEISDWEPHSGLAFHERLGRFSIAEESREPAFQIYEGRVHVDASIEVTFALETS